MEDFSASDGIRVYNLEQAQFLWSIEPQPIQVYVASRWLPTFTICNPAKMQFIMDLQYSDYKETIRAWDQLQAYLRYSDEK